MTRTTKHPPTGKCKLGHYVGMLISEPKTPTCTRLGETINISHDSVNRFLERETHQPKDLFNEVRPTITDGGIISVDDTVLDKPHSKYTALVGYYYSGKHHKAVKGINLITLYYTDTNNNSVPINYRLYDPKDNKTKNDYFLEMLDEVINEWGLKPSYVTADSWYSPTKNLKHIRKHGLGFMVAVKSNRNVSIEKGTWTQVQAIENIDKEGLQVWLKNFGLVTLFRTRLKDQVRHYVMFEPPPTDDSKLIDSISFQKMHDSHWQIETYHRALKQLCSVEKFQVRREGLVRNHIFASILGFVYLKKQGIESVISMYAWVRNLFTDVVADVSFKVANDLKHLNPRLADHLQA